ncbi:MAG: hypothetical protein BWY45_02852 [Euryarchaeota archaeon ADurb.Bin294]|nr:MAG: hypothetical protein BWY45_02852 [Euryarchaeota archaeon ADurb.Bin294]
MLRGISTGIQFPFNRRTREYTGVSDEIVDGINALVQVILDLVEVSVIRISDLRGDVTFRDTIHILGSDIQGADNRIKRVINPFGKQEKVALIFIRINPCIKLACFCSMSQTDNIPDCCLLRSFIHIKINNREHIAIVVKDREIEVFKDFLPCRDIKLKFPGEHRLHINRFSCRSSGAFSHRNFRKIHLQKLFRWDSCDL